MDASGGDGGSVWLVADENLNTLVDFRYKRSHEVVEILRQAWTRDHIEYSGDVYQISKVTTDPARPYQQNGGPLLYFGGYSPDALELCGAQCDVYLMWPEPMDVLAKRMRDVHARAEAHGRSLILEARARDEVADEDIGLRREDVENNAGNQEPPPHAPVLDGGHEQRRRAQPRPRAAR